MPGLDQRGPRGEGPMTGRKAGKCTNFGAGHAGKAGKGDANATDAEENVPLKVDRGAGRSYSAGRGGITRRAGQSSGRGAGSGRGSGHGSGRGRGR